MPLFGLTLEASLSLVTRLDQVLPQDKQEFAEKCLVRS